MERVVELQKTGSSSTCHFGPFGCLPADIWILLAHKYLPHSIICRLTSINSSLHELFSAARVHRSKKRICKTTPSLIAQYKYEDNNFALQPQKGNAFLPDGRPILWIRKTEDGPQAGDNTKATFFLGILNFPPAGSTPTSDCSIAWTRISPICYSGVEGLQISFTRRLIYFLQILEDKKRICLETLDLAGQSISSHELDVLFLPSPVHYAIQTQFILDDSQDFPRFIIIQPFLRKATLITFSSETAYCLSKFEFAPEIRNRLQLQSIVAALDSKSIYLATNRIVVQISLADLKQQTLLMLHPHRTITGIEADEDNTLYICTCRGGWFHAQLIRYVTAGQRVEGTAAASAWAVPCAAPPVRVCVREDGRVYVWALDYGLSTTELLIYD